MKASSTRISGTRLLGVALVFLSGMAGCHSAFVQTTIENQGPLPVKLVEVAYPSASFGVGTLAAHGQFNYRFKIQGSGALKLEFTDSTEKVHSIDGPVLTQGQEGHLTIVIGPNGEVTWQPQLVSLK